ncbi:bifunctional 5,10-methylene-tetrahydrofolate dehydrogenase/5,10-methylene-tetrahydrofolate cyclohydrolase [Flavobacteriaceae bacterium]|nr:bifunctional 5,10-methylene-tetrahydrofolate dehydrogenase/5,10-methylene-tetrahydrofolate cyclohydrolase [Flavobacteriaceae bacterium]MDA9244887.1 bifunctional 5,10-methylene-tetrahydrofolate dehydrogenase/5,10-methylene-tetrahydrofolate cyclohydrolase [Flavobacteriaceae bacterium]MDA9886718.1 bifunctional 5,10-methylene-tetrahydrofolate dehydrogenase/5,10-methylene-tetrahydrofolate cyclohydrolase [Flavobacteriaceae bacterium]MDA9972314.1 bifunctional 5,10-methylene-tetrahydrofolate dehydrog
MIRLDGKETSNTIKEEIKVQVTEMKAKGERVPHLAAVLVGTDGASLTYVGSKVRSCEYVGFESTLIQLEETITEEVLLAQIDTLNKDERLDGYIVQLPLPKHINEEKILLAIDPKKDVDGFHPANFGRMALDLDAFIPATPFGIMQLLERYKVPTSGKHCVVVGRSHIVGRPISILMSQKGPAGDATVTVAHSRTKNLAELTKQADIIVMALGIPEYLTADMVKEGAAIIDVGITRVTDESHPKGYVIKGDVAFDEVAAKASYITPVPGGVGPMTIAMLLKNTLLARQWNQA